MKQKENDQTEGKILQGLGSRIYKKFERNK